MIERKKIEQTCVEFKMKQTETKIHERKLEWLRHIYVEWQMIDWVRMYTREEYRTEDEGANYGEPGRLAWQVKQETGTERNMTWEKVKQIF